jgi:hypothetical protein
VLQRIPELNRRYGDWVLATGLVALMIAQVLSLDISRANTALAVAGALALLVPLALRVRMPLTLMFAFWPSV